MSKVTRTFSTKVRFPYQDAIGLILHMIDYHYDLMRSAETKKEKTYQEKQARRLKTWLVDQKEWILLKEAEEERRLKNDAQLEHEAKIFGTPSS